MTATNPHPLANPLNQGRFRNYAYGQKHINPKPYVHSASSLKELTVPDSTPYDTILQRQEAARNLTVPNSDIPYCNGSIPSRGFIGDTTLFKLADGSILDLKTCKIVLDPNIKWKARGYWNDPNANTKDLKLSNEWSPTETIESMLKRIGNDGTYEDPNLSPESIRYWKIAQEESKKLEQNMTDEQKKLLDALNSGNLFPLSKLIDEN